MDNFRCPRKLKLSKANLIFFQKSHHENFNQPMFKMHIKHNIFLKK